MKRFSIVAIIALLALAMGAGTAFADVFVVRGGFGVQVQEDGTCERAGTVSVTPDAPYYDALEPNASFSPGPDRFTKDQVIRVELLGNVTLCKSFSATYIFTGDPQQVAVLDSLFKTDDYKNSANTIFYVPYYTVSGARGADYFTITINVPPQLVAETSGYTPSDAITAFPELRRYFETSPAVGYNWGNTVYVGQEEYNDPAYRYYTFSTGDIYDFHDDESPICLNLKDTLYEGTDPNRQLVQVSLRDQLSNTFSSDIYIATVKTPTIILDQCTKNGTRINFPLQDQCDEKGKDVMTATVCAIEFSDSATGSLTGPYTFSVSLIGNDLDGVGIARVSFLNPDGGTPNGLWDIDGDGTVEDHERGYTTVDSETIKRYAKNGNVIASSYSDTRDLYVDTQKMEFQTDLTGPQTYQLWITLAYDACQIEPGTLTVDVSAMAIPCGNSFSMGDVTLARFMVPEFTLIFPYAAASVGGWSNGLAINNPNDEAIEVTFVVTEADGAVYNGTLELAPTSMEVGLAESVMSPVLDDASIDDEAFGDESYWILTKSSKPFFGFIFIGDGTMAQGYIPSPFSYIGDSMIPAGSGASYSFIGD